MVEEWRSVPSLGGKYEVSNLGRIRHSVTKRIRKPQKGCYLIFVYNAGGGNRSRNLHKIVAECFLGPCPAGCEVNHKNGNKYDASASNLEYVTRSENALHAYSAGLSKPMMGSKHPMSKLTEDQVLEVIRRRKQGEMQKDLAVEFGVSDATISEAISGKLWKHIKRS